MGHHGQTRVAHPYWSIAPGSCAGTEGSLDPWQANARCSGGGSRRDRRSQRCKAVPSPLQPSGTPRSISRIHQDVWRLFLFFELAALHLGLQHHFPLCFQAVWSSVRLLYSWLTARRRASQQHRQCCACVGVSSLSVDVQQGARSHLQAYMV